MENLKCVGTTMLVEKLRLPCLVGALDPERSAKQTVLVDIACKIGQPPSEEDELCNWVDYSALVKRLRVISADGSKRKMLETLAAEIARICLEDHQILQVKVTVRKPNKLADVKSVGITRVFERGA